MADKNDNIDKKVDAANSGQPVTPTHKVVAPLNYISILRDLQRWRASAKGEMSYFDFPGHVFFKIIFHFNNNSDAYNMEPYSTPPSGKGDWEDSGGRTVPGTGGIDGHGRMTGLLGPSWLRFPRCDWNTITSEENTPYLWEDATAWSYFAMNDDEHRAKAVQTFTELLSNINSYSPWYFQKISGLDAAINREVVMSSEFTIKNEREKITIECLQDSYDQRIGTLLDLYREIVWSWETKREMLPRNLRKFDMTIVAFQLPVKGKDVPRKQHRFSDIELRSSTKIVETPAGYAAIYDDEDSGQAPLVSYKAYEFHGCEIDYNSSKSGQASLNNETGDAQQFNIDIYFDDMFEIRFNEFLNKNAGQYITDIVDDITAVNIKADSYDPDHIEVSTIKDDDKKDDEGSTGQAELSQENVESIDANQQYLEGINDDGSSTYDNSVTNTSINPKKHKVAEYTRPDRVQIGKKINLSKVLGDSYPNIYGKRRTYGTGVVDQIIGGLAEYGKTQIKKIYLGNIAGLSISKVRQQIESLLDGNVGATVGAVSQYIRGDWDGGEKRSLEGRDIFPDPPKPVQIQLGNIFRANTILNS